MPTFKKANCSKKRLWYNRRIAENFDFLNETNFFIFVFHFWNISISTACKSVFIFRLLNLRYLDIRQGRANNCSANNFTRYLHWLIAEIIILERVNANKRLTNKFSVFFSNSLQNARNSIWQKSYLKDLAVFLFPIVLPCVFPRDAKYGVCIVQPL